MSKYQTGVNLTEHEAAKAVMVSLQRRIADLEKQLAEAHEWTVDDQAIPEDDAIHAAHPLQTDRHDLYTEAMRIVGAKRSKAALVDVVNWLLFRGAEKDKEVERMRPVLEAAGKMYRGKESDTHEFIMLAVSVCEVLEEYEQSTKPDGGTET